MSSTLCTAWLLNFHQTSRPTSYCPFPWHHLFASYLQPPHFSWTFFVTPIWFDFDSSARNKQLGPWQLPWLEIRQIPLTIIVYRACSIAVQSNLSLSLLACIFLAHQQWKVIRSSSSRWHNPRCFGSWFLAAILFKCVWASFIFGADISFFVWKPLCWRIYRLFSFGHLVFYKLMAPQAKYDG